ncbi:hypothetical protein DN412_21100 [Cupriavidus lacunae]|uniref:Uncharacterized protein n=1 Tax=Cupriavidus lacunae TaxID=2666307 RepID=A0A370NRV2_9BURK|nr:hypothetical protein DN412_21100 [Cupriavidus lacunae]
MDVLVSRQAAPEAGHGQKGGSILGRSTKGGKQGGGLARRLRPVAIVASVAWLAACGGGDGGGSGGRRPRPGVCPPSITCCPGTL